MLELLHGLLHFLVDHLAFGVAFDVVLAECELAHLECGVGQQVDSLGVIILGFVELLQQVNAVLEFSYLHEELRALSYEIILVLLPLLQHSSFYDH